MRSKLRIGLFFSLVVIIGIGLYYRTTISDGYTNYKKSKRFAELIAPMQCNVIFGHNNKRQPSEVNYTLPIGEMPWLRYEVDYQEKEVSYYFKSLRVAQSSYEATGCTHAQAMVITDTPIADSSPFVAGSKVYLALMTELNTKFAQFSRDLPANGSNPVIWVVFTSDRPQLAIFQNGQNITGDYRSVADRLATSLAGKSFNLERENNLEIINALPGATVFVWNVGSNEWHSKSQDIFDKERALPFRSTFQWIYNKFEHLNQEAQKAPVIQLDKLSVFEGDSALADLNLSLHAYQFPFETRVLSHDDGITVTFVEPQKINISVDWGVSGERAFVLEITTGHQTNTKKIILDIAQATRPPKLFDVSVSRMFNETYEIVLPITYKTRQSAFEFIIHNPMANAQVSITKYGRLSFKPEKDYIGSHDFLVEAKNAVGSQFMTASINTVDATTVTGFLGAAINNAYSAIEGTVVWSNGKSYNEQNTRPLEYVEFYIEEGCKGPRYASKVGLQAAYASRLYWRVTNQRGLVDRLLLQYEESNMTIEQLAMPFRTLLKNRNFDFSEGIDTLLLEYNNITSVNNWEQKFQSFTGVRLPKDWFPLNGFGSPVVECYSDLPPWNAWDTNDVLRPFWLRRYKAGTMEIGNNVLLELKGYLDEIHE